MNELDGADLSDADKVGQAFGQIFAKAIQMFDQSSVKNADEQDPDKKANNVVTELLGSDLATAAIEKKRILDFMATKLKEDMPLSQVLALAKEEFKLSTGFSGVITLDFIYE